jgi:hypothetical protein
MATLALELLIEDREPIPHLGRRAYCAESVILVCGRNPEGGHDRIPDELLNRAAVPLED